jgi:hypothetical protein
MHEVSVTGFKKRFVLKEMDDADSIQQELRHASSISFSAQRLLKLVTLTSCICSVALVIRAHFYGDAEILKADCLLALESQLLDRCAEQLYAS